jgi:hypothetical protein
LISAYSIDLIDELTLKASPLINRGYSLLHPRFGATMGQHPEGVPRNRMEIVNGK